MSLRHQFLVIFLGLSAVGAASGATTQPFVADATDLDSDEFANWIAGDFGASSADGVKLFQREFELEIVPESFVVHVSADPRYQLYVNGRKVGIGPAVGDRDHWHYESIELAPWLQEGRNVVAASVWNPALQMPARQITVEPGFILAGPEVGGKPFITDASWLVQHSAAHTSLSHTSEVVGGGYIAGATEAFDARVHAWGWNTVEFDASAWRPARVIGKGTHGRLDTWQGTPWSLISRPIPALEMRDATHWVVRRVAGEGMPPGDLVDSAPSWPIKVPANSEVTLLLDHEELTMGFPQLHFAEGRDASIEIRYQEALFQPDGGKDNRDEIAGKIMKGYFDRV